MLDARELQSVGADRTGFRVHTDQPVVPDERHAGAAHQTAPQLHEPCAHRGPEGGPGRSDPGAVVRHTLHTHTVPAQAQDDHGNRLPDILGRIGFHPGERPSKTFLVNRRKYRWTVRDIIRSYERGSRKNSRLQYDWTLLDFS